MRGLVCGLERQKKGLEEINEEVIFSLITRIGTNMIMELDQTNYRNISTGIGFPR
jgi:hypothetical protein